MCEIADWTKQLWPHFNISFVTGLEGHDKFEINKLPGKD